MAWTTKLADRIPPYRNAVRFDGEPAANAKVSNAARFRWSRWSLSSRCSSSLSHQPEPNGHPISCAASCRPSP